MEYLRLKGFIDQAVDGVKLITEGSFSDGFKRLLLGIGAVAAVDITPTREKPIGIAVTDYGGSSPWRFAARFADRLVGGAPVSEGATQSEAVRKLLESEGLITIENRDSSTKTSPPSTRSSDDFLNAAAIGCAAITPEKLEAAGFTMSVNGGNRSWLYSFKAHGNIRWITIIDVLLGGCYMVNVWEQCSFSIRLRDVRTIDQLIEAMRVVGVGKEAIDKLKPSITLTGGTTPTPAREDGESIAGEVTGEGVAPPLGTYTVENKSVPNGIPISEKLLYECGFVQVCNVPFRYVLAWWSNSTMHEMRLNKITPDVFEAFVCNLKDRGKIGLHATTRMTTVGELYEFAFYAGAPEAFLRLLKS